MAGVDPRKHVLKVVKNIYGGKDAGRTWNKYLVDKLRQVGFKPSQFDDCVFFKGNVMYTLYTDDSILAGPDPKELDQVIEDMKGTGLQLTSEAGISDFLGVNISERQPDSSYHLTQPRLIDNILKELEALIMIW